MDHLVPGIVPPSSFSFWTLDSRLNREGVICKIRDDKKRDETDDQALRKIHAALRELTIDEMRQLVSEFKTHGLGDAPTYFSCGADRAEFDFEDDARH